jgi:predicted TIM-barrel fold metal-dependent hydrolase
MLDHGKSSIQNHSARAGDRLLGAGPTIMNYLDAHVHVWTDDFARYPLSPNVTPRDMAVARFLPEDLFAHAHRSGVRRFLLIQMSYYGTDNRYMLDVIRNAPDVFRGIAVVDPQSSGCDEEMRRLKALGVRGFRIAHTSGSPTIWPENRSLDKMFDCAARERLAICPLINPEAVPSLSNMCARFPETPVVVDHLARIGMAHSIIDEHVAGLCSLARYPEVRVKISAFYALGEKRPPHLDLMPLIRRIFEAYGARRLMWGSDCPFQILKETYEDSLSLVRDRLDFLSDEDKDWILGEAAEELFFGPLLQDLDSSS